MLQIQVKGCAGSGKSTIAFLLAYFLRDQGLEVEVLNDNGTGYVDEPDSHFTPEFIGRRMRSAWMQGQKIRIQTIQTIPMLPGEPAGPVDAETITVHDYSDRARFEPRAIRVDDISIIGANLCAGAQSRVLMKDGTELRTSEAPHEIRALMARSRTLRGVS